jgi:hypothetical protein
MPRLRLCLAAIVCLLVAAAGHAADNALSLATAQGVVDKVEKDSLTIRPRGPDGRFDKSIKLRLTGTSQITTLTSAKRGAKTVVVQRTADARDLSPKQNVAIIFTTDSSGPVLLSAVAQPAGGK